MSSSWNTAAFLSSPPPPGAKKIDILRILFHPTGESLPSNKMSTHTQTPTQRSLDWNDNTELAKTQTCLIIPLSLSPSLLLSFRLALQRQPILCAAAHYAGWWLSPCQLTVQLAYLRLAQTLILAGERTVYTYWCPHSYAPACTSLIVKQLRHMRGEALWKIIQSQVAVAESHRSHTDASTLINCFFLIYFIFFMNYQSVDKFCYFWVN